MKGKVFFLPLGCDKNFVDSEKMLALLAERGYTLVMSEDEADIAIINTCCFICDAKQESIDAMLAMAELRKNGSLKALVVTGCLAERYRDEIRREIPEVDLLLGTMAIDKLADALDDFFRGQGKDYYAPLDTLPLEKGKRLLATGGYYAYLKIAEGCDKHCTYCIIPSVRGPYRSVPMEHLVAEAETLAKEGVRELILVAQETTLYGQDLYGKKSLPELLRRLCQIDGLRWIRILYCYPEEIDDALIEVMRTEPKICHYLDLPIQHSCDRILGRMGRHTTGQDIEDVVGKLREAIPDICLRTTLIAGFPGETKDEHAGLCDFVKKMAFDRLGVFPYSQEEGTPAAEMPDQISEKEKEKRRDRLMALQQDIAFAAAKEQIGRTMEVMIEGKIPEEGVYVARTYRDAPDVDGLLFLETERELYSGDFVSVRVTDAREYDLIGERIDEPAE